MIAGAMMQRILSDGQILVLIRQFYNWQLTLGRDEYGWEQSW